MRTADSYQEYRQQNTQIGMLVKDTLHRNDVSNVGNYWRRKKMGRDIQNAVPRLGNDGFGEKNTEYGYGTG